MSFAGRYRPTRDPPNWLCAAAFPAARMRGFSLAITKVLVCIGNKLIIKNISEYFGESMYRTKQQYHLGWLVMCELIDDDGT